MSSWSPGLGSAAQSGHGAAKGAKVDAEGGKWMGKAEMGEIWGPISNPMAQGSNRFSSSHFPLFKTTAFVLLDLWIGK